jgi:hypothetical protein
MDDPERVLNEERFNSLAQALRLICELVDSEEKYATPVDISHLSPAAKARGTIETIATGLSFPAGITFGPDGALYVSNFGFGFFFALGLNSGQIVRIRIPD